MAFIHYLHVGHFVPYYGVVRFENMRPLVERPLDGAVLRLLLTEYLGPGADPERLPPNGLMRISGREIVCNRYGSCRRALQFVVDYVNRTGGQIVDMGSLELVQAAELLTEGPTRPSSEEP